VISIQEWGRKPAMYGKAVKIFWNANSYDCVYNLTGKKTFWAQLSIRILLFLPGIA